MRRKSLFLFPLILPYLCSALHAQQLESGVEPDHGLDPCWRVRRHSAPDDHLRNAEPGSYRSTNQPGHFLLPDQ
jgi:hypothetical protein